MKRYLQKLLSRFLFKHLYNLITEEDLLRVEASGTYVGDQKLTPEQIDIIRDQAEKFDNSALYNILRTAKIYNANKRIYKVSTNTDDILAGKLQLEIVKVESDVINQIRQL